MNKVFRRAAVGVAVLSMPLVASAEVTAAEKAPENAAASFDTYEHPELMEPVVSEVLAERFSPEVVPSDDECHPYKSVLQSFGDKDDEFDEAEVVIVQRALTAAGIYVLDDGDFGPATKRGIRYFQERNGLHVDCRIGPETWAVLSSYISVRGSIDGPAEVTAPAQRVTQPASGTRAQQQRVNELLAEYGYEHVVVDGIHGQQTGQGLCAARFLTGLGESRESITAGSDLENALLSREVEIPEKVRGFSGGWIAISRVCQVLVAGEGDEIVYVFQTSTGEEGYETRTGVNNVYRYRNPDWNGGWHNSTNYPVSLDNPLNGNMYKPLYFDGGQAVHGATNIPRTPASKGCARLSVGNQDKLVTLLGFDGVTGTTYNVPDIRVAVYE